MITGGPIDERVVSQPPVSLWRNQDFLLLWIGQGISLTGSQVSQFAFPLLLLTMTGSPARPESEARWLLFPSFFWHSQPGCW